MSTQAASPLGPIRRRVARLPHPDGRAVSRARLRVVPRRRTGAARIPFVTLVSLVMVGGVVGLLLFNTSMQQASFAVTSLEEQARTLSAREQTLRMELDDLRDPQRVAEQAQQMGMVPAVSPAFLNLADGSVVGEPVPATRMSALRIQPRPPRKPAVLAPEPIVHKEVADTGAGRRRDAGRDRDDGRNDRHNDRRNDRRDRNDR